MWRVKPNFELPEGFELREDSHFVELWHKDEKIGTFLSCCDPFALHQACEEFQEKRRNENA